MKHYTILFLKGMAMGIANVIPGVSGGTIALITSIYETLIKSLKSFDKKAFKLIIKRDLKGFIQHTNLYFLLSVFSGSIVSVFSIANLFEHLFNKYPTLIWAFFFGLIMASILLVGNRIKKWNKNSIFSLALGTIIAISLSFIDRGGANDNLFFVFVCGIIGISGMMLPGLSGSFILILMGNYELLMVDSITEFNPTLLSIFLLGGAFGLVSFSHLLAWVFKHYRDVTLALLTGFILGSLSITWPWQTPFERIKLNGEETIISYTKYIPNELNQETIFAVILIILGIFIAYSIEMFDTRKN